MTTLELADAIAKAVIAASRPDGSTPYGDAPTQAVLDTLRAHDSWFCRITLTDKLVNGLPLFEPEPEPEDTLESPYEAVEDDAPEPEGPEPP